MPKKKGNSVRKTAQKGRKVVRTLSLTQIANRLYDALDARKHNGLVAEVANWRHDERYPSIRLLAALILRQEGNLPGRKTPV